jgi:hypothetical protein
VASRNTRYHGTPGSSSPLMDPAVRSVGTATTLARGLSPEVHVVAHPYPNATPPARADRHLRERGLRSPAHRPQVDRSWQPARLPPTRRGPARRPCRRRPGSASGPAGRGLAMTGDVEHREQTPDQARELTNRIRDRLDGFIADLLTAWNGRADKVLGYTNRNAYVVSEFGQAMLRWRDRDMRRHLGARLREIGMPTRAIGSALGVHHRTVERDLVTTGASAPDGRVLSLDSRSRPASRSSNPVGVRRRAMGRAKCSGLDRNRAARSDARAGNALRLQQRPRPWARGSCRPGCHRRGCSLLHKLSITTRDLAARDLRGSDGAL